MEIASGIFFISGLNGEQKASLVQQCITLVKQCNVTVANITFDGMYANIKVSQILGCNSQVESLKTGFDGIDVILDPSHMIKLVGNTFGEKQKLK